MSRFLSFVFTTATQTKQVLDYKQITSDIFFKCNNNFFLLCHKNYYYFYSFFRFFGCDTVNLKISLFFTPIYIKLNDLTSLY